MKPDLMGHGERQKLLDAFFIAGQNICRRSFKSHYCEHTTSIRTAHLNRPTLRLLDLWQTQVPPSRPAASSWSYSARQLLERYVLVVFQTSSNLYFGERQHVELFAPLPTVLAIKPDFEMRLQELERRSITHVGIWPCQAKTDKVLFSHH